MAVAIQPFSLLQIGVESSPGTLVAATDQLVGRGVYSEAQQFYRSQYSEAIRGTVGGAGIIVGAGSSLVWTSDLTLEELIYILSACVKSGVTPTGAGPYVWLYEPELDGAGSQDTYTVEVIRGDGSTNHYYREFGYAFVESFKISWGINGSPQIEARWHGRKGQSGTATGSLTPIAGRQLLQSNLLKVYIDNAWANLGTTQLEAVVTRAEFEFNSGAVPDITLDGRADLDMTRIKRGRIKSTLGLTLKFDSVGAAAAFTQARSNALRYVQLLQTGPSSRQLQIDGAYRFASMPTDPNSQLDGDDLTVPVQFEGVYDETGTKQVSIEVTNSLAAL